MGCVANGNVALARAGRAGDFVSKDIALQKRSCKRLRAGPVHAARVPGERPCSGKVSSTVLYVSYCESYVQCVQCVQYVHCMNTVCIQYVYSIYTVFCNTVSIDGERIKAKQSKAASMHDANLHLHCIHGLPYASFQVVY